jgi:hypothetical protein
MGRHAQPREVAELKGATRHNPQRYRGTPAKNEYPVGDAPEHLPEDARAVWFELSALSLPGVLTGADRLLMEIVSNLVAEYRRDPDNFKVGKHSVLKGHMATMGITPSARQQFTTPDDQHDNPYANLEQ